MKYVPNVEILYNIRMGVNRVLFVDGVNVKFCFVHIILNNITNNYSRRNEKT